MGSTFFVQMRKIGGMDGADTLRGDVTFLSPNKKVTKEVGLERR